jgi:hypothetical protein
MEQAKHPHNHIHITPYEKDDSSETGLLQTIGKLAALRKIDRVANAIRAGLLEGSDEHWELEGRRRLENLGIEVKSKWDPNWTKRFEWEREQTADGLAA